MNCSDHELNDAHNLALPYVTHALRVVSSACSFSIVPWSLFRLNCFPKWTPWCTHFGSATCEAYTLLGKLGSLFSNCTMNSFPTVNSFLTVNSVMQSLWLCAVWHRHYVWWALLSLFLLYCELFRPWTPIQQSNFFWLWNPWRMHFGSAQCDALTVSIYDYLLNSEKLKTSD